MEKATIEGNKLSLEVTRYYQLEFPVYRYFPDSYNQVLEKRSLLESGNILIESVSPVKYETQEVLPRLLRWDFYVNLPSVAPYEFERLKKEIVDRFPEKIVHYKPLLNSDFITN